MHYIVSILLRRAHYRKMSALEVDNFMRYINLLTYLLIRKWCHPQKFKYIAYFHVCCPFRFGKGRWCDGAGRLRAFPADLILICSFDPTRLDRWDGSFSLSDSATSGFFWTGRTLRASSLHYQTHEFQYKISCRENLCTSPKFLQKPFPLRFHGAFAPSFIHVLCRGLWL